LGVNMNNIVKLADPYSQGLLHKGDEADYLSSTRRKNKFYLASSSLIMKICSMYGCTQEHEDMTGSL